MADDIPDPAASALDGILHGHRQHVSVNYPAPGICVSRCADSQPWWPCGAYRAAAAAKAALKLADDWDSEAARLLATAARLRTGANCAKSLREAITAELAKGGWR